MTWSLNVRKAYWGRKLARELLDTLDEGTGYIDEAQKKIDKQLAEGVGNVTVTDRLRLRTVRAEIDARTLETKRLAEFALAGLRTLLGPEAPADLEVDDEPLAPLEIPSRPVSYYEESARPESARSSRARLCRESEDCAVRAGAAKGVSRPCPRGNRQLRLCAQCGHSEERLRQQPFQWPRLRPGGGPPNAAGPGAADGARRPHAWPRPTSSDTVARGPGRHRTRGPKGLWGNVEAQARVEAVHKGEKAGKAWVTAVAQNFAIGLAEARDFSDALTAFFQMRARYLQSVYDLNVASAALERATGAAIQ